MAMFRAEDLQNLRSRSGRSGRLAGTGMDQPARVALAQPSRVAGNSSAVPLCLALAFAISALHHCQIQRVKRSVDAARRPGEWTGDDHLTRQAPFSGLPREI